MRLAVGLGPKVQQFSQPWLVEPATCLWSAQRVNRSSESSKTTFLRPRFLRDAQSSLTRKRVPRRASMPEIARQSFRIVRN